MGLKACLLERGMTADEEARWFKGAKSEAEMRARVGEAIKEGDEFMLNTKLQLINYKRGVDFLEEYRYKNKSDAGKALLSTLAFDKRGMSGKIALEQRGNFHANYAFSKMNEMMEGMMPKLGTGYTADKTFTRNLVEAIFGKSIDDADAMKFAKVWRDTVEDMRTRYNALGGKQITKKQMYGMPQSHNALKMRKVGREKWISDIVPMLNYSKMWNKEAGKRGFTEEEIRKVLKDTYDNIITDGAHSMTFEKAGFTDLIAESGLKGQHRWMEFTDGETWLKYQQMYGEDDTYSVMLNHINSVGREIALKEEFGPNPAVGYNMRKAKAIDMMGKSTAAIDVADLTWKELTGQLSGRMNKYSQVGEAIRGVMGFKLGAASVSSIADQGTLALTAIFNGLPVFEQMQRFISGLNPKNLEDRRFLAHAAVNANYVIDSAVQYGRLSDTSGHSWFTKMNDRFLRVTFLNVMTEAGKNSYAMSTLNMMATVRKTAFENLDQRQRRLFERYGITSDDWDKIRKAAVNKAHGTEYADPTQFKIRNKNGELEDDIDLMMKVSGMIDAETHYAIPEADAQVRAMMSFGLKGGTVAGEGMKNIMQFKSFGVSVMVYHFLRAAAQDTAMDKASYLAKMFLFTTMMGAIAVQAKQALSGKETYNMSPQDNKKFWVASIAQGGGFGFFGDLLFSDKTGIRSSMLPALLGPTAADADRLIGNILVGNTQKIMEDLDAGKSNWSRHVRRMGSDTVGVVKSWLPTQAFQTKLLFDRLVYDQAKSMIDPNFAANVAKRERRMKTEEQRGYYWKPGNALPDF